MKVTADTGKCVSSGQCVLTAPEIFDQREEDGLVVVLDAEPPPALHALARESELQCPVAAIRLLDT
ncbi:ferredoxin [Amycolatopsis sp. NPDC059657]|uniref:ferredoxin n=1 Tax=Amycolatopsis sp. NPDC059657 TaxID=3346899 RepID=UPI0036728EFD